MCDDAVRYTISLGESVERRERGATFGFRTRPGAPLSSGAACRVEVFSSVGRAVRCLRAVPCVSSRACLLICVTVSRCFNFNTFYVCV